MPSRVRTSYGHTNRPRLAVEVLEDRTVPHALLVLTDHNTLFEVDSSAPQQPLGPEVSLTGLAANERILAIDFRPATGELYGVSDQQRLYEIDRTTGVVGRAFTLGNVTFTGNAYGLDFDPVRDEALIQGEGRFDDRGTPPPSYPQRVQGHKVPLPPTPPGLPGSPHPTLTTQAASTTNRITDPVVDRVPVEPPPGGDLPVSPPRTLPPNGTDPRFIQPQMVGVNPSTGTTTTYQPPDNDNIGGIAFTNNFTGATSTTLYLIDFAQDTLQQVSANNPNATETKGTVGAALNVTSQVGFDIAADGTTYVSVTPAMVGSGLPAFLYTMNLENGSLALLGAIGSNQTVIGLSVIPPARTAARLATVDARAEPAPEPPSSALPVTGDVSRSVQIVKVRGKKGQEQWKFRYDGPGMLRGPFKLVLYRNAVRGAKRTAPVAFRTITLGDLDAVRAGEALAFTLRLESRKDIAGWRLLAGG